MAALMPFSPSHIRLGDSPRVVQSFTRDWRAVITRMIGNFRVSSAYPNSLMGLVCELVIDSPTVKNAANT